MDYDDEEERDSLSSEKESEEAMDEEASQYSFEQDESTVIAVTGGNGYLGSHIVTKLLERNIRVLATVRSLPKASVLNDLKMRYPGKLEIAEIRLEDFVTKWIDTLRGCKGIIHTASPNMFSPPRSQIDLIVPAVEGMVNIYKAAIEVGVKKIVLTGCISNVRAKWRDKEYSEEDWADVNRISPIERSKLLAERTAWSLNTDYEKKIGLTVILPGFLIGPSVLPHYDFASGQIIKQLAEGEVGKMLKMHLATCDVRDAAEAHIAALYSRKKSNGKRFICVENSHWFEEFSIEIADKFKPVGFTLPTETVPKWKVYMISRFDVGLRPMLQYYNKEIYYSNERLTEALNISYFPFAQSVETMIEDMIEKGSIKKLVPIEENDGNNGPKKKPEKDKGIFKRFCEFIKFWQKKKEKEPEKEE